jgi:hypothetical protein
MLCAVIAFVVCAAILLRFWPSALLDSEARPNATDPAASPRHPYGERPAPVPNPAAQRAGPPDPEVMKSASRSAEQAARAAAALAPTTAQ